MSLLLVGRLRALLPLISCKTSHPKASPPFFYVERLPLSIMCYFAAHERSPFSEQHLQGAKL